MSSSRARALLLEGPGSSVSSGASGADGSGSNERSPLLAALAAEGMLVTRADLTSPVESWGVAPDVILLALDADAMALAEASARMLLNDERFDAVPILLLVPSPPEDPRAHRETLSERALAGAGAGAGERVTPVPPPLPPAEAPGQPKVATGFEAARVSRLLAEGAFDYMPPTLPVAVVRSRLQAALRWRKRMRAATETPGSRSATTNGLPSLPPVPLTQRALRVSGAVVRGSRRTGASFDVALDEFGRLTLFAFDAGWPEGDAAMKSFAVRRAVREALDLGFSLDAVAADAVATLRSLGSDTLGLVALRFSADSTTLEVLDCGFAPVFELESNGNLVPLAPPSARLGVSDGNRFSASMLSVRNGSLYIAISRSTPPAATPDATLRTAIARLADAKDAKGPLVLASMTEPELRFAWQAALGTDPEDDVVVLVAGNDPSHISQRP